MSGFGPMGGGQNPFEGIFGDLARMLGNVGAGPLNWDVARQVAAMIAGEGRTESNVEPVDRIRIQELARVAEMHVDQVTPLDVRVTTVKPDNHIEWASVTLDDWKGLLERMATSMSAKPDQRSDSESPVAEAAPDALAQFAQMEKFIAPVLLGMQAGGMVGHLARRSFGRFDLPLPRRSSATVGVVPENIKAFADEWSLPADELTLFVLVEEVVRTAILDLPHVKARMTTLLEEYAGGFSPDPEAITRQLGDFDMSDPTQLPEMMSDPETLLGAMQTDAQRITLSHISGLTAAIVGYVDHVTEKVGARAIPAAPVIFEAIKRRRVEESDGSRLVEKLLGMELGQAQFDRGAAFIDGVVSRSGEEALALMWRDADTLPTPAEIDAPGLWLARLGVAMDESQLDRAVEVLFDEGDFPTNDDK